jgi:hypothetical protein
VDAAYNMGGRGVMAAQSSEATSSMEKEEEKGAGRWAKVGWLAGPCRKEKRSGDLGYSAAFGSKPGG